MPMTPQELIIYKTLQDNPDYMYQTPDGSALYALVEDGLMCITSELDFNFMTEADINEAVVKTLTPS